MAERGTIAGIDPATGNAIIIHDKFSETGGCEGCGKRFLCDGASRGKVEAANPLGLPLEAGLKAETEALPRNSALEAAKAILPPLGGFVIGFIAAGFVPGSTEAARAAAGAFFMLLAGALYCRRRIKRPPRPAFTVTKIL